MTIETQTAQFTALAPEATLSQCGGRPIEEMIVGRHVQPGDRLPTERELARQFGVKQM